MGDSSNNFFKTIPSYFRRSESTTGSSTAREASENEVIPSSSQIASCSKEETTLPFRLFVRNKALRVRFYRNGDQFFKGIWLAISPDRYRTLKALIEDLNRLLSDSIALPHGVRHIFTLDGLKKINSIYDFKDGNSYVCSSTESYKQVDYLNAKQPIWYFASSKFSVAESLPPQSLRNPSFVREPNDFVFPRIITIIRNGVKPRRVVRHLLNKKTAQSFDQVMHDITSVVKLDTGAVRKLFTLNGKLVSRLVDFFGEEDAFIAYGTEKTSVDDFFIITEECKRLYSSNARRQRHSNVKKSLPMRNDSFRRKRFKTALVDSEKSRKLPSNLEEQIEIIKLLGDGNTALVYEVVSRQTLDKKALKIISKENAEGIRHLIDSELFLMQEVSHEFIVQMHEYWLIEDAWYISLELVPGGDLFESLKKVRSFPERSAASLIRCLASALSYLHSETVNIVHRDVKPENLLIYNCPQSGLPMLKLADFGLAAKIVNNQLLYDICGTPTYVAPEVLAEFGYGFKIDIWSTGIILYVILCGFPPFMSMEGNQEHLFEQILRARFSFPSPVWENISYSAKALIQGLLTLDIDERYSADQILDYQWVQQMASVDESFEEMARLAVEVRLAQQNDEECDDGLVETDTEYYYSRRASMDELSECNEIRNLSLSPVFGDSLVAEAERQHSASSFIYLTTPR
uniref:non-specific serine/threonine protein kinase n=1 Tax=Acrobeloides nanus TaxID=290746 RepID=A0A914BW94_9BILA